MAAPDAIPNKRAQKPARGSHGRWRLALAAGGIALTIVASLLTAACDTGSRAAEPVGAGTTTLAPSVECAVPTPPLPDIRVEFAQHAGLGLGAFYFFIFRPVSTGHVNKLTVAFAPPAAFFSYYHLREANRLARMDPRLCRVVSQLVEVFRAVFARAEAHALDPPDMEKLQGWFEVLKSAAVNAGASFQRLPVSAEDICAIPGLPVPCRPAPLSLFGTDSPNPPVPS
ncbi:hypothetical protein [Pseudofrankia saprophytica]|uniref:hypothetical protein n=1 Tax=Pseudofrankia saprophytica TaxID=298655 RepID=UPI0012FF303E|nr:hypothetical protein [Pseudofrankia saprophytica]